MADLCCAHNRRSSSLDLSNPVQLLRSKSEHNFAGLSAFYAFQSFQALSFPFTLFISPEFTCSLVIIRQTSPQVLRTPAPGISPDQLHNAFSS